MASADVVQVISHYQRDIEKICVKPERALKYEDRLLHCLTKLHKLPVTISHLQATGVGKTVNSLRKLHGKKGVSDAAKALVAKWKAMVIEEDEEERRLDEVDDSPVSEPKRLKLSREEESREYSPESTNTNGMVDYKPSSSNSTLNLNAYSPQSISQTTDSEASYSPSKKPHKPNGYNPGSPKANGIEVYCYSPSKKYVTKHEEKRKSSKSDSKSNKEESSSKRKIRESNGDEKKSSKEKDKSSREKSSRKDSPSSKHGDKDSSLNISKSFDSKSKNSSFTKLSSNSKKSSSSSSSSSNKHKEKENTQKDDSIDSLSGTSFAAALGPMIVKKSSSGNSPKKKPKTDSGTAEPKPSSSKRDSTSSSRKSTASFSRESISPKQLLDDVAGPSHLPPLDLDVVSTLSVPTPHYKPMPQLPLSLAERRRNNAEEEDALAKIMSNKNSRTKVYSGIKGGLSYVPSLYEICCRVLQQHIDALEYTGGIPYSLLKPVLDAATPSQLYQFENYNPYIIGDTDQLWQFHVNREFRGEQREEMETAREMYLRCVDEREAKYKSVTANIQEAIKKSVPVRQTKLAYVDVAKPPRNILKKQIKNGTTKPDAARLLGKTNPDAVPVRPTSKSIAPVKEIPASFRLKPKVAPLMQKTLKSIKSTHFRR